MAQWQTPAGVWIPNRITTMTNDMNRPGARAETTISVVRPTPKILRSYYDNDSLYLQVQTWLADQSLWTKAMKPIRNPAHASVEFFAATLWGDLNITTPSDAIANSLTSIDKACKWNSKLPVMARWAAIYGDVFIKVQSGGMKTLLNPESIGANFAEDEHGNLIYLRIDIPVAEATYTEIWNMVGVRIWKHKMGMNVPESLLGVPETEQTLEEMKLSYIPIVHGKFLDTGDLQGYGSYGHCLDDIDEANMLASRLHQMLFRGNKPFYAIEHTNQDAKGNPYPPVKLDSTTSGTIELGDDIMLALPGGASLKDMIPNIRYADALAILESQMKFIQDEYLPELNWYHQTASANASGRALRIALTAAVARCKEARGNMDATLIRADQIALELAGVGTDIELSIPDRSVIPDDSIDQATEAAQWAAAGFPIELIAKRTGWSDEEIVAIAAAKQVNLASAMSVFNAGQ